jgi:hypothetical protein
MSGCPFADLAWTVIVVCFPPTGMAQTAHEMVVVDPLGVATTPTTVVSPGLAEWPSSPG